MNNTQTACVKRDLQSVSDHIGQMRGILYSLLHSLKEASADKETIECVANALKANNQIAALGYDLERKIFLPENMGNPAFYRREEIGDSTAKRFLREFLEKEDKQRYLYELEMEQRELEKKYRAANNIENDE